MNILVYDKEINTGNFRFYICQTNINIDIGTLYLFRPSNKMICRYTVKKYM